MNALAVLGVAEALGLDLDIAAADLGNWTPPEGRGSREVITLDATEKVSFTLIDDAFNANPASLAASLEVLAATPAKARRIAILGDMLELGTDERALHANIADLDAMEKIDQVHCCGDRMEALWMALPVERRGLWFATADEMVTQTRKLADAGDVVLVKGSKGSLVSRVVDALRKLGQGDWKQEA